VLLAAAGKGAALTHSDLQAWTASLSSLTPASQARKIRAVKSLLSFGERTGYFNVGAALPVPAVGAAAACVATACSPISR